MMAENMLTVLVVLSFTVLLLVLLFRKLNQPYFIAYIIAGILLGPQGFELVQRSATIDQLGEMGVILLMFFIGAEINFHDLAHNFKKPLLGALSQLVLSFVFIRLAGMYFNWTWTVVLLLTFVISLSSSAIIFQYLTRTGEMNTRLGLLTSGVLIMQDIMVVPMLLTLNFLGKGELQTIELGKALVGSVLILLFLRAAIRKKLFRLPFAENVMADHDIQVFLGFSLCFGMAWITHWFGLSAALGAFVSGIIIGQEKATQWLDKAMIPFRTFFLAFFFLSVGLQIQLDFLAKYWNIVVAITMAVFVINSLFNAVIFRWLGSSWRNSIYAGALLSQIGEFSFVLVNVAAGLGIIEAYSYQITLSVIALTMLFSTIWISVIQRFIYRIPALTSDPA